MKSKTQYNDRFVIIMAGGRGERFWPVSREKTPKQLISLLGPHSFLQMAVDRVLPVVPLQNIIIITNQLQVKAVMEQLPVLPPENIIAEPVGRDTCAAVVLGAAVVGQRSITGVMAVLPADHVIPDEKKFQKTLEDAFEVAAQGQVIVTIGIQPTEPHSGYGYIKVGDALPAPSGIKLKTKFYKVEKFVEKPSFEKAYEYVSSGQYRWNAGMFVWSFVTVTEALTNHQPEMAEACHHWFEAVGKGKLKSVLAREYPEIKKISIDYALLEKAHNVVVANGDFAWDDLGSWPALVRHLKGDSSGNRAVADFVQVDSKDNIIYDARSVMRSTVCTLGMKDCIIVLTDDATLVAHKTQSQRIKELVKKLSESKEHKKIV